MYDTYFWINLICLEFIAILVYILLLLLVRYLLRLYHLPKSYANITKRIKGRDLETVGIITNIYASYIGIIKTICSIDYFFDHYIQYLTETDDIKLIEQVQKTKELRTYYYLYKIHTLSPLLLRFLINIENSIKKDNKEDALERLKDLLIILSNKNWLYSYRLSQESIIAIIGIIISIAVAFFQFYFKTK